MWNEIIFVCVFAFFFDNRLLIWYIWELYDVSKKNWGMFVFCFFELKDAKSIVNISFT